MSTPKTSIVLAMVFLITISMFPGQAGAPCQLPDLPTCACYSADCDPVACSWPLIGLLGDIVGTARLTVATRSCCIAHGGTAYWQIQRQASIPEAADNLAFHNPNIEIDHETAPQAWCTETIAFWGLRACVPYAEGYYTAVHHQSSYVTSGGEMRKWYETEELRAGASRGRWIDATELDYANFEPGVNGPCPGAYQQIYGYDPLDPDGNGNAWDDPTGHSQLIDSMIVYRVNTPDGPARRIDIRLIEGNVGWGGANPYARIINHRWYYDILDLTPLGTGFVSTTKKIRGWGINLNADGTVRCDCDRIRTEIVFNAIVRPGPQGPEDTDSAYVAAMEEFLTETGGNIVVTTNSTTVQTGGALPSEINHWVIPPPPHPEDPVWIEVDLLGDYPDRVKAITLEWLDAMPGQFEVQWAGDGATFQGRALTLPTGAPPVPTGTALAFPVAFTPTHPDTGHVVRYVRLCVPQSALTRTFEIQRFHYNYFSDEIEEANGLSPEGDAGNPWAGVDENRVPSTEPWLRSGFPNPFQSGTSVAFGLPEAGTVRLSVYDVQGRCIRVVLDRFVEKGSHTVLWDGRTERGTVSPSGVYFIRLEWNGRTCTQKVVLTR